MYMCDSIYFPLSTAAHNFAGTQNTYKVPIVHQKQLRVKSTFTCRNFFLLVTWCKVKAIISPTLTDLHESELEKF